MCLKLGEPCLQEMLEDPTIRVLMESDGVSREDIEHLVRVTRLRLRWTGVRRRFSVPAGPALPALRAGSRA